MAWITLAQADNFLGNNPTWDVFTNKEELLDLASNRLEQLTFKGEPVNRVEARYLDGNSLSKIASSDDFLLDAQKGNWEYHESIGWTRTNDNMGLHIYGKQTTFLMVSPGNNVYQQNLTLNQIQSLHSYGGTFETQSALDSTSGNGGSWTAIETQQANAIVDKFGEQVFLQYANRKLAVFLRHNGVNVYLHPLSGVSKIIFDGVETVEVITEQGDTVINTVPEILPPDFYKLVVKVIDGLDNTLFMYMNGVLVANPVFDVNVGTKGGNRLLYQTGTASAGRISYIRTFGSVINVENPITIPIRLVGACALLAFEYGKFPPNFVGDKQYLENQNDYNRMQDLPINVQSAVEPFLSDYEGTLVEGIATTNTRGEIPTKELTEANIKANVETTNVVRKEANRKLKDLEYK